MQKRGKFFLSLHLKNYNKPKVEQNFELELYCRFSKVGVTSLINAHLWNIKLEKYFSHSNFSMWSSYNHPNAFHRASAECKKPHFTKKTKKKIFYFKKHNGKIIEDYTQFFFD